MSRVCARGLDELQPWARAEQLLINQASREPHAELPWP